MSLVNGPPLYSTLLAPIVYKLLQTGSGTYDHFDMNFGLKIRKLTTREGLLYCVSQQQLQRIRQNGKEESSADKTQECSEYFAHKERILLAVIIDQGES